MVAIYCAVEGCWGSKESKHRFPNPEKYNDLCKKWVMLCGNKRLLEMTLEKVYSNCRVCKMHFTEADFGTNNKLTRRAYPTKFLPAEQDMFPSTSQPQVEVVSDVEMSTSGEVLIPNPTVPVTDECKTPPTEQDMFPSTSQPQVEVVSDVEMSTSGEVLIPNPTVPVTDECKTPPRRKTPILWSIGLSRQAQLTPKKKTLYKQLTQLKQVAYNLNKSKMSFRKRLFEATKFSSKHNFEKLVEFLNPIQKRFFECQLENARKKAKGRRFTDDDKILALALSKQTGSGYKYLSYIFALPSKQTIAKFLNRIPIKPGLNDVIFNALKAEAENFKNEQDKYCILIFDEMSIATQLSYNQTEDQIEGFDTTGASGNEFANHALVFMVRGLRKRWKQPIFYNFTAGPAKSYYIADTIKALIKKLKEAGLIVCAVVCDQGTNNCAAVNSLVNETRRNKLRRGEDMDISEFYFEIDEQTIVPLFDPPHLIKCIRNNMVAYNLKYISNGVKKTAKWDHLLTAYKMDPYFGSLRTMPKLTDFHVVPEKIAKMKVSFCTQMLSRTVASAINLMAHSETTVEINGEVLKMEKKAMETAEILEFFDNLFDSLNSIGRSTKVLRRPVRENSPHFKFWNDAIHMLNKMEFVNKQGKSFRPPCLNNFVKTVRNFMKLFHLLKGFGFEYLKTRQLNQDPLENFFGQMRQRGGRYVNPTCEAFGPFYKSLLVKNLTAKHASGSNCSDDKLDMFLNLKNVLKKPLKESEQIVEEDAIVTFPEVTEISFIENQALNYVLGFVLKKIKPRTKNCALCSAKMFTDIPDESHNFTLNKEYVADRRSLIYISSNFQKQLGSIYLGIKYWLRQNLHKKKIVSGLLMGLKEVNLTCDQHTHYSTFIIKKFVRVNLYNIIKQINNILNSKDTRKLTANTPAIFHKAKNVAIKKHSKKIIKY